MKKITGNYEGELKDDLQTEADTRKLTVKGTGANGVVTKDDLVLALQIDDESKVKQPPPPLPKLKASPIPQVAKNPTAESGSDPCPYISDERFTDGVWTRTSDGEDYALCIHDADGYGNTHTARNSVHQWQGIAAGFNADFQKK